MLGSILLLECTLHKLFTIGLSSKYIKNLNIQFRKFHVYILPSVVLTECPKTKKKWTFLYRPQNFHEYNDTCPSIIKFFRAVAFASFVQYFDDARIERTREFIDEHCMAAAGKHSRLLLFYVHGKHLRSCRDGQLT